jgi:hypothetical protein
MKTSDSSLVGILGDDLMIKVLSFVTNFLANMIY